MLRSELVGSLINPSTYNHNDIGGTVVSYPARVALEVHMSHKVNTVEMKKQRDRLVVTATGRTPRGVKYIKQVINLNSKSTKSPGFKKELARAVNELLAQQELPPE